MMTLNNGLKIPMVGLGTYNLHGKTCEQAILEAISFGYRLIDTAFFYDNEKAVGNAIRKAISEKHVQREELFVISKLFPSQFSNPKAAMDAALQKLNIGYLDMMLLHHPGDHDVKAYQVLESYVQSHHIKSLGLSNFYIQEIDEFLPQVSLKPALVQNEIHPYYQDRKVTQYLQQKDLAVQAYYPLAGRGHQQELLTDPILSQIAKAHNKSVAQVILRWNVQNNVIVVPGSSNPKHLLENITIFDFKLSEKEMAAIASLNRDEKHDWY